MPLVMDGRPQDPIPPPDNPDQPLRGPEWAARELRRDRDDEDTPPAPGRRIADEDRRRTPQTDDITDHAP
jgi:hypothetical protein